MVIRSVIQELTSRSTITAMLSANANVTDLRLHLQIPVIYHQQPILSTLISDYGLVVNITSARLGERTQWHGWFDLELQGTTEQISKGLAYLASLKLEIVGKPNPAGDSWHC